MKKLKKLKLRELGNKIPVIPQTIQEQIKGGDGTVTVVFDRSDGMIYIYANGSLIDSCPAANNVSGGLIWPDGTYSMRDQYNPVNGDYYGGSYGSLGGYVANSFYDPYNNCYRTFMAIHACRYDDVSHYTNGCIRTTSHGIEAIGSAICNYGPFTSITVQE